MIQKGILLPLLRMKRTCSGVIGKTFIDRMKNILRRSKRMPASLFWTAIRHGKNPLGPRGRRYLIKVLGIVFLFIIVGIEVGPLDFFQQAKAVSFQHTSPTVNGTCS